MVLEKGVKIYDSILKRCVNYVNNGWGTNYSVKDVVGLELGTSFLFVHFDEKDYTKEAYPISIDITFV